MSKADDLLKDAKGAFEIAQDNESENRKDYLDDIRFARLGEQWPDGVRKERDREQRPCLTVNKLPAIIRQVVNDGRQNKPAINVHPVDGDADVDTAEIFDGLIRNIEQSSDAEVAYDTGLDCAVTGGFGYWKVNTRYAHDDTFEQDIVIERVANPLSIYGDPDSTAADSSDWNCAFELDSYTSAQFEKRWPDAEASSFTADGVQGESKSEEKIVVAAYWKREEVARQIVMLSSPDPLVQPTPELVEGLKGLPVDFESPARGVAMDVYEQNKGLFDALGVTIVGKPRNVPSYKVTQRLLSGGEVLETVEWAGKYIPIIPVYGEEINVEGKRYFRSLVRDAKDPQRMFNYWRTTSTELVALAPKAPFIGRKGAFETDAAKWATANSDSHAFIEYDGQDPPQRQPFSGVPAGALQEALNASDDIKAITGLYDASLGARSNETSGRAIRARQMEGDTGTFHYIDNLSRAIRHTGRVLIDMIPKVYSVPRMIRVLGPQMEPRMVRVNAQTEVEKKGPDGQPIKREDGQIEKISRVFDLTVGKYDLTVKSGPSFTSKREEFVAAAIELIRAYPPGAPLLIDQIVENFDLPGGKEIAARFKAMIPPQAMGENPLMEEAKKAVQGLQGQLQQAMQENQGLKADKVIEAEQLKIQMFEAETGRMKVEADAQANMHKAQAEALEDILTRIMGPANEASQAA
jgi:hypothetical protein